MALNPNYENANTLKKLTVGGATYFLKDADLRALVESFGSVVYKDVVTTFNAEGADIATEKAIAEYIKNEVSGLSGAMHFVGVTGARSEGQSDIDLIATLYADGTGPENGDVAVIGDNTKEYICTAGAVTVAEATWEEVGDQSIYLTIASAKATYVPKTTTIAGNALTGDISTEDLSNSLDLKALSHKDSASGNVDVIDTISDITVAKAGEYNVSDQTTVDVAQSFSSLDVTPAGTVDLTAGTAAAASYEKTSSATISSSNVGDGQTANYTPSGTVSLPSIVANVSLTGVDVATVTDAGTGYTLTNGSVTQGTDSTASFVKKGVSFAVDTDDEALTLSYVGTDDTDFYASAVTAAGAVSYTAPTLSGSLPTFSTQSVAATTGVTATASYDGNASFSGEGTILGAALAYTTTDANVTQPTFTAAFTGTSKSVTPTAATTAAVAQAGGKITVASEDKSVGFTTKSATVTVK